MGFKEDDNIGFYNFIIDDFTWSYSRVNSYNTCPRMFFLQYIESVSQNGNFFADWGLYIHSLLEQYYKKELAIYELVGQYENGYEESITHQAPPNKYVDLSVSYYNTGKEYFENFEDKYEDHKILGVEDEIKIDIDGRKFTGYIDLNTLSTDDGIYVIDNKSKKSFKNKKEEHDYLRQLYLYSIHIFDKYGEYPTKLIFNMVRGNVDIINPFCKSELDNSKKWFHDEINKIYNENDFLAKPNKFFCDWLCSVGKHCEHSYRYTQE